MQNISRRKFIFASSLMALHTTTTNRARSASRPNILLILADDLRSDGIDLGYRNLGHTPNIRRLADGGVIFKNNFVTSSICPTSRASIVTGTHAKRHGIWKLMPTMPIPARLWQSSFPVLLRNSGHRTGFVGKWGVGGMLPVDYFDYWTGYYARNKYFWEQNGGRVHDTALQTERALEGINNLAGSAPFALTVSYMAPHSAFPAAQPFPAEIRDQRLLKDAAIQRPKTADAHYFERLPSHLKNSEGRKRWKAYGFDRPDTYRNAVRGYLSLVAGIDRSLGRLIDQLKKVGAWDNTICIVTSDNGFFLGERGLSGKWLMYEESIRTPLIVGGGGISRVARVDRQTLNIDLAPTLLDLAGAAAPVLMQGKSLVPFLERKAPEWRSEWFYEFYRPLDRYVIPPSRGIRTDRWKYFEYTRTAGNVAELYDLENDPHELENLAARADHSEQMHRLRNRMLALEKNAL